LNHNFPADVCLPLFCKGVSHHRILRIATAESVVLNSANAAPFLILVEVLEDKEHSLPISESTVNNQQTHESLQPLLSVDKIDIREGNLSQQELHQQRVLARRKSVLSLEKKASAHYPLKLYLSTNSQKG
jgi:hypothetical protein